MEPDKEKARLEQEKVEAWKKKQYDLNSFERKQLKKRGVKICPESDLEFASAFMIISFAISVPFENNSVWFQKYSDWPRTETVNEEMLNSSFWIKNVGHAYPWQNP